MPLNDDVYMQQLEPSKVVSENGKCCDHFRKKVCQFPLKEKKKIASNNSLLGIHSKDIKKHSSKRLVQNIRSSFIHNKPKLETHQMSINEWINKL